ncbi:MAG TPA: TetR/AcrR family transcriptional regulator [Burkholderiaceae bacterium]
MNRTVRFYGMRENWEMKKSDSKRQAILDAAYRLFRTQGFERTSVSEITAQVGGSKATIYSYFASKEELFVECMIAAAENFTVGTYARLGATGADLCAALQDFGTSFLQFSFSADMVAVRRLMIAEAERSGTGRLFYAKITSMRANMAAFLSECMASGRLRRDDPVLAADQLRALLEAEVFEPLLLCARERSLDDAECALAASRAVAVFLRAYAPSGEPHP